MWTAVSVPIVNTYKQACHGLQLHTGWSGQDLDLAAILFVDNTDLTHLCSTEHVNEVQFANEIQSATTLWETLLQATGGNLKLAKCYFYLLTWKFDKGKAHIKSI